MKRHLIHSPIALALLVGALAPLNSSAERLGAHRVLAPVTAGFVQSNLVADLDGRSRHTDPQLVNPWGLYVGEGFVIVADNHSGVSTFYGPGGKVLPLTVTIPPPAGGSGPSAPTGLVLNDSSEFLLPGGTVPPGDPTSGNGDDGDGGGRDGGHGAHHRGDGSNYYGAQPSDLRALPSIFIYVTEDGTIAGWNPDVDRTHAILVVDNSGSGAVYKGVALTHVGGKSYLFAANFKGGVVEMYDGSFQLVKTFTDTTLPAGYAPFGIRSLAGGLWVTFAKHLAPDNTDDEAGAGHGYIDVFTSRGDFVRRFASEGTLNSPWGLALAPAHFGVFSHALLVGNFGDGRINAFNPWTGDFLGQFMDTSGQPVVIEGLWSLGFSSSGRDEDNRLYFTAGPDDESHGLLGVLLPHRDRHNREVGDDQDD